MIQTEHPAKPQNVTGVINGDGSITVNWDKVEGALSYLTHYGDANQGSPLELKYMGYSETNSWTLAAENVPELQTGEFITITVQTYNVKAPYLHDGPFTGSAWSTAITLTKE